MTQVNLIVVDGSEIHFNQDHYTKIISYLSSNCARHRVLNDYLDGGYLLIDFNKRIIINSQSCFKVKKNGFEIIKL